MSSETVTRNDLENIFNTIMPLPIGTRYSIISAASASQSFAANTGTWVTIKPTLSANQEIIGITGWYLNGIGTSYLYNYRLTAEKDGVSVAVYNATSSAKTGTVTVDFLVAEETFETTPEILTTTQTITTFSSGWTVYDSSSTVILKKNGRVVSLTGAIKNTAAVTLDTEGTRVFYIPEAFVPTEPRLVGVYLGSGTNRYGMSVYGSTSTDPGGVYFERCTNSTSFASMAANSWFPFHMTWILG